MRLWQLGVMGGAFLPDGRGCKLVTGLMIIPGRGDRHRGNSTGTGGVCLGLLGDVALRLQRVLLGAPLLAQTDPIDADHFASLAVPFTSSSTPAAMTENAG
ncbi:MAG: hypothetical protein QOC58_1109 [Mycobacterium sp.]|nr:hypothetical protein [Mycobacterium sp.]